MKLSNDELIGTAGAFGRTFRLDTVPKEKTTFYTVRPIAPSRDPVKGDLSQDVGYVRDRQGSRPRPVSFIRDGHPLNANPLTLRESRIKGNYHQTPYNRPVSLKSPQNFYHVLSPRVYGILSPDI